MGAPHQASYVDISRLKLAVAFFSAYGCLASTSERLTSGGDVGKTHGEGGGVIIVLAATDDDGCLALLGGDVSLGLLKVASGVGLLPSRLPPCHSPRVLDGTTVLITVTCCRPPPPTSSPP